MKPVAIDFETEAIEDLPHYPPKSVGVAILDPEGEFVSRYYAYGHSAENDATHAEARAVLQAIWSSGRQVVMHNSSFDMAVCHEEFGLPYLPAERYHDTLFLAFLYDPYAPSLSLKSFCKEYLGIKPDERDELFEWLVTHVDEAKRKPKSAGAHICKAPGRLVGRYAMADVRLTLELFDFTAVVRKEQPDAYVRELRLMPILNENAKLGVRVDREGLQLAFDRAVVDIGRCDAWLDGYFGKTGVNYNSGQQLVKLIFEKGLNTEADWPLSLNSGVPLSDKETLRTHVKDPILVSVLRHRDALTKISGTYLEPFLRVSAGTGRIYTGWNQVRGEAGGTRTGRLSAKPTLQTLVSRFPKTPLPDDLQGLQFPRVRQYLLPDDGHVMVAADFQAQELRLFAHFEGGKLASKYREDPRADLHQYACDLMSAASGRTVIRDHAKTMSFGILYGAGPQKISEMLGIEYNDAKSLIDLYKSTVATGLSTVNADLEMRYRMRKPFRTIGGRLLKGEAPKIVNNKLMKFGFKSLNALIQGSGADMTKEAMVLYASKAEHGRLLLSLHDEIVCSVEEQHAETEGRKLTWAMENAFRLDVPMLAEAKTGRNFAETK